MNGWSQIAEGGVVERRTLLYFIVCSAMPPLWRSFGSVPVYFCVLMVFDGDA